jgi:hypothetical protein
MSTLKTNTIQHLTSGFNNIVTHTDGAGTVNAAHARAWVNFDGSGTVAIRASFNVSSITDNGTGDYTANFSNSLSDGNYAWSSGVTWSTTYGGLLFVDNTYAPATGSLRFYTQSSGYSFNDSTRITVTIFR